MTEPSPMAPAVVPPPPPPPQPPPPPPPPPPPLLLSSSSGSSSGAGRLRSVFWERIPQERVEGRRSVWTKSDEFLIDLSSLDELFGQRQGHRIQTLGVRGHHGGDKHTNTNVPRKKTLERISILEGNRSLKVGIFLHHFKSSLGEIINDIREGRGQHYGSEKLNELYRLLPDGDEEQRLRSFRGEHSRLEEADLFMLHLVEIPSFRLRLEAMILQEEFDLAVTSVSSSAHCLKTAATELMSCVELHCILRLVLKAGNYMNAGGFAGNAAGFRIASLLKLADTKANRPGMNLLHFVAMEAVKKNPSILSYHLKLSHVGPAARLSVETVQEEFSELQSRVTALLEGLGTALDLHSQITPFLQVAELKLSELQAVVDSLCEAQRSLQEFFCEDDDGLFKLEEACGTFHNFQQRFLRAAQENELREQQDLRRLEREQTEREKVGGRRSIASCSALEEGPEFDGDALEMILRTPEATSQRRSLWSTPCRRTPHSPAMISVIETEAENTSALGSEAGMLEGIPESAVVKKEADPTQTETPTEAEQSALSFTSAKVASEKSSTHSSCLQSTSHKTLGARLRPHVGERHTLVSGLRSYSSLAPPTGRADQEYQEERTQEVGETSETTEQEVKEATSSHVSGKQRDKPGQWTAKDAKAANQNRNTATPLLRASRLPLPRTGSLPADRSGTVGGASEREGPRAKMPQPLKRLLDRASNRKEREVSEKAKTESDREKREKEKERKVKEQEKKREKEREKQEKEKKEKERERQEKVKEKKEKEREKQEKEKKEKEREKREKEKEKQEKEREKREKEKEKQEKEREKREKEKVKKEQEKERMRSEKEKARLKTSGAKERSMERSVRSASALAVSVSRPLSRLCPAAAPLALASVRCTAKALHSALKRDRNGSSSRIPAPTGSRALSLPRPDCHPR